MFSGGAIIPLKNHNLPCMSMGFLLPRPPGADSSADVPVVWRGLMVQKAVQQLLLDVDWREDADQSGPALDVLVVDMPPGTGDVPLTLGQLVNVDGKNSPFSRVSRADNTVCLPRRCSNRVHAAGRRIVRCPQRCCHVS